VDSSAGSHAGGTVMLTLNMSEAVTVTGTPTLMLDTGAVATYSSGSGSSSLNFSYAVTGNQSPHPTVSAVLLNGGSIQNDAGTDANLSLADLGFPLHLRDRAVTSGTSSIADPMIQTGPQIAAPPALSPPGEGISSSTPNGTVDHGTLNGDSCYVPSGADLNVLGFAPDLGAAPVDRTNFPIATPGVDPISLSLLNNYMAAMPSASMFGQGTTGIPDFANFAEFGGNTLAAQLPLPAQHTGDLNQNVIAVPRT